MDGGVSFRNAVIFGIGVGIGHLVVHATYSLMLTGTIPVPDGWRPADKALPGPGQGKKGGTAGLVTPMQRLGWD